MVPVEFIDNTEKPYDLRERDEISLIVKSARSHTTLRRLITALGCQYQYYLIK